MFMKKTLLFLFMAAASFSASAQCSLDAPVLTKSDIGCYLSANGTPNLGSARISAQSTLCTITSGSCLLTDRLSGAQVRVPATAVNGELIFNLPNLTAGSYSARISAVASGATVSDRSLNFTINRIQQNPVTLEVKASGLTCPASVNNVILTSKVTPATSITQVYDFLWSTGETTANITVNSPRNYTLTATEVLSNGTLRCPVSKSIQVNPVTAPDVSYRNIVNANCGRSDGSVSAVVTGGSASPFTYDWTSSRTPGSVGNTLTLNNIPSGQYKITVKDSEGCLHSTIGPADVPENNNCARKIEGFILNDLNANCTKDATDLPLSTGYRVQLTSSNGRNFFYTTNAAGFYSIDIDALEARNVGVNAPYRVSLVTPNRNCFGLLSACNNVYANQTVTGVLDNRNFYLGTSTFKDVSVDIVCGTATTGTNQSITVRLTNNSCETTAGSITLDGTNVGTFSVAANQTQNFTYDRLVNVAAGQDVRHDVRIVVTGGDQVTANDQTFCQVQAVNPPPRSSDPNTIAVSPVRDASNGGIFESDVKLNYIVNFMNVGLGSASMVRVENILEDTKLDIASLDVIGGSHDYTWTLEGNTLVLTFKNITLLPNALDDAGSRGWFAYTLKRKSDLPKGTAINNQAAIYFDFNEAVVTNQVRSTIISPLSNEVAGKVNFMLIPNPTTSSAKVSFTTASDVSVKVFNINGQVVATPAVEAGATTVELGIENLPASTYFVQVQSAEGVTTQKLIKQ
jgi:hypothetical protein